VPRGETSTIWSIPFRWTPLRRYERLEHVAAVVAVERGAVRSRSAGWGNGTSSEGARVDARGRSVLITGGSRGIGLAAARLFLSLGANVTIGGRDPERLEAARASLAGGDRVSTVAADVASIQGCRATVGAAAEAFGRLDVLFTNAGDYRAAPIGQIDEEVWDRTIDTHLKGTFFCIQAALPMLREASGSVVTMASDAGLLGLRGGWAAYSAAKGGVVNLTRQLAVDLAPVVRVNAVAPGPVGTEHLFQDLEEASYGGVETAEDPVRAVVDTLPLKRLISPEEVAEAVVFLASNGAMTGAILNVDAGTTSALP
jgi:NAD(P)-dependent dehydrogenase (short-subunit alcohol dehydrogenase family)